MAAHDATYEPEMTSISSNILPYGSRTDVGYVREHNEDSLLVAPPLYVVCDGMGGHEAGEVASDIAIRTISQKAPAKMDADALGRAVEEANLAILDAARKGIGREGMGTTCTAAILDGTRLAVAQVGDSRAYLLHNGSLQQLTRDHSVVADLVESGEITPEEARTHQWRSYITRALGLDPYVKPDLYEIDVEQGDRLMLCSDGLYSMVPDVAIEQIMATATSAQDATDLLVDAALSAGGSDNVSVIVVDVTGYSVQNTRKAARRSRVTAAVIIALMVVIIGGTAAGFGLLMNSSAYLGEVDGKVAIYKGVPDDMIDLGGSGPEQVTDIPVDALQPGTAERIKSNDIRFESVQEAERQIQEYKRQIQEEAQESAQPDDVSPGAAATGENASASNANASSAHAKAATEKAKPGEAAPAKAAK